MALSLLIVVLISNATRLNSTAHHDDIDKVIDLILDEVTKIEESELTDYNYTRLIFFILLLIIIILVKSRLYRSLFNCCCRRKKREHHADIDDENQDDINIPEPVQLLSITQKDEEDELIFGSTNKSGDRDKCNDDNHATDPPTVQDTNNKL